jgi:hypothetical protein
MAETKAQLNARMKARERQEEAELRRSRKKFHAAGMVEARKADTGEKPMPEKQKTQSDQASQYALQPIRKTKVNVRRKAKVNVRKRAKVNPRRGANTAPGTRRFSRPSVFGLNALRPRSLGHALKYLTGYDTVSRVFGGDVAPERHALWMPARKNVRRKAKVTGSGRIFGRDDPRRFEKDKTFADVRGKK